MGDPASSLLLFFQDQVSLSFTEIIINFLLIFLIVALNAFFVASEFALVSVRRLRIQTLAEGGNKNAEAALRLLENPTLFISAVQLGVTLASLALGWRGAPTIADLLCPLAENVGSGTSSAYIASG